MKYPKTLAQLRKENPELDKLISGLKELNETSMPRTAVDDGYDAFESGQENPYDCNSPEFIEWNLGLKQAEIDDKTYRRYYGLPKREENN